MNYIDGKKGRYYYVIGLETHAQITSSTKLFSSSKCNYGSKANSLVNFFDIASPGSLPVLNELCLHQAIKTGLGLNAKINLFSAFDRKNYFYADLPSGYQITQFYHPIAINGHLNIEDELGNIKKININRLHIEQDAGKSTHDILDNHTLLDYNRSGIGLMEIVTEPEISSPEEAANYLKKLRTILKYIGSCDADMEKGSLRCDANVSVRKEGQPLGTRCEIKNLNSIRNMIKAIEYEAERQVEILESGREIDQETRLFDANNNVTRSMRSKEEANDYRYFPDPDLLPVNISKDLVNQIKSNLPELPDNKINRYVKEYNLNKIDATIISSELEIANYFEKGVKDCIEPKSFASWIIVELFSYMNKNNTSINDLKFNVNEFVDLVNMISKDIISGKIAKIVFEEMFNTGMNPNEIIRIKNLDQISDKSLISSAVKKILDQNQDSVKLYLSGKDKLLGFFVGQVMKETKGKANPKIVNQIINEELKNYKK